MDLKAYQKPFFGKNDHEANLPLSNCNIMLISAHLCNRLINFIYFSTVQISKHQINCYFQHLQELDHQTRKSPNQLRQSSRNSTGEI